MFHACKSPACNSDPGSWVSLKFAMRLDTWPLKKFFFLLSARVNTHAMSIIKHINDFFDISSGPIFYPTFNSPPDTRIVRVELDAAELAKIFHATSL